MDRQRNLSPRDYADPPQRFGWPGGVRIVIPEHGDEMSALVAAAQHRIVVVFRATSWTGAGLARRVGISKQTVSRTMLGERWIGETLFATLLWALDHDPTQVD